MFRRNKNRDGDDDGGSDGDDGGSDGDDNSE